ncbi:hypothetical protein H5J24_15055 [Chryseobacterium capnotolerans]|uniref:hypothetical protein n=1 Tax=Chryseobacterium TaxID=59732 RepID=UPI00083A737E|nr:MULTISPECIES: hypothetical protein [Chryseobacterium]UHO37072.1 hypothetical protein H5J24_15055 [Chryseobacterium capnotolerans]
MKYLIGLLIGFFSIFSCQKNNQKEINQSSEKLPTESKNYVVFKKEKVEDLSKKPMIKQKINWDGIYWLYPYNIDSEKQGNYYINISKDNNEFGFSGDIQFNYKINYKSIDNKLYIFDNKQSDIDPLAVIYKEKDKYYIKSDLIKMERTDLKETKNGYPIRWAKSSDDVPDSPQ